MNVGVFYPPGLPASAYVYVDNVMRRMETLGTKFILFSTSDPLPEKADIYWDFRCMGGGPPFKGLRGLDKPVVATVHGAGAHALAPGEYSSSLYHMVKVKYLNAKGLKDWRYFKNYLAAVITVSNFAKKELEQELLLQGENIEVIYHGIDHEVFNTSKDENEPRTFLLHISQHQPSKNLKRIFAAYDDLSLIDKPTLLAVVPGYQGKQPGKGITVIRSPMSPRSLALLYEQALAFVFPSIRESFGMPILEAMACGCPVITSNNSGCAEVAGDAAVRVDPRSTDEIRNAINDIVLNDSLRNSLKQKGLVRARQFSWEKSAGEHFHLFKSLLEKS